jgi:hypothetical protein
MFNTLNILQKKYFLTKNNGGSQMSGVVINNEP